MILCAPLSFPSLLMNEVSMSFFFLGTTDFRKVGGWVFTSAKPSPLAVMHLEQCRRQLTNKCFDCNGSHHVGHIQCKGPNQDCWYKCVHCHKYNNVSSRGQSRLCGPVQMGAASFVPPREVVQPVARAKAGPPPAPAPAPAPTPSPALRKRPAGAAFQRTSPALPFREAWSSVKVRKCGRYRSVKDILVEIDTVKAGRATPTIGQRIAGWARRFQWPDGSYASFAEFAGGYGGGKPGVGCTERAAKDIYTLLS